MKTAFLAPGQMASLIRKALLKRARLRRRERRSRYPGLFLWLVTSPISAIRPPSNAGRLRVNVEAQDLSGSKLPLRILIRQFRLIVLRGDRSRGSADLDPPGLQRLRNFTDELDRQ
jgi:hypothetical protein